MKVTRYLIRKPVGTGQIYNVWLDKDKTILRMVFKGSWGWRKCFRAVVDAIFLQVVTGKFRGIIYDLSESDPIPDNYVLLGNYNWLWDRKYWPSNEQRIVVIGGGKAMDDIFAMRQKIAPLTLMYFRRADSLEEAVQILRDWD